MKSLLSLALVVIALVGLAISNTACKSGGSYEYKPGKGWVPN